MPNPGALQPLKQRRAQAIPQPAWWEGERTRVKGLTDTPQGMPTAALADEILIDGPGQVRALFALGGNPAVNFPDQSKVVSALRKLDLLVVLDVWMSQTARLADYVFANKLSLEMPGMTAPASRPWTSTARPSPGSRRPSRSTPRASSTRPPDPT